MDEYLTMTELEDPDYFPTDVNPLAAIDNNILELDTLTDIGEKTKLDRKPVEEEDDTESLR